MEAPSNAIDKNISIHGFIGLNNLKKKKKERYLIYPNTSIIFK